MRKAILFVLVFALAAFGLANGQGKRKVKPGDVVTVHCDEESSVNKQYTITKDGFIVMPLVGALQVGGLSEIAAGAKIGTSLVNEKIVPRATMDFKIMSSKTGLVSFTGSVRNSGEIPPRDGLTLADVVKAAQPDENANLSRVRIVTGAGNEFIVNFAAYDGSNNVNNPQLIAGDTVFFDSAQGPMPKPVQPSNPGQQPTTNPQPAPSTVTPSAPSSQNPVIAHGPQNTGAYGTRFITVMGAVVTQQTVPYSEGMTVNSAIQAAGGLLKNSDPNVTVERKIDGSVRTYRENISDVEKGMAGDMALRPNDVINVGNQGHSRGPNKTLRISAAVLLGILLLH